MKFSLCENEVCPLGKLLLLFISVTIRLPCVRGAPLKAVKGCLFSQTIPQSPSVPAPFTQGSLIRRHKYQPQLFTEGKKLHCAERATSPYRRYNFTDEVNFTLYQPSRFTVILRGRLVSAFRPRMTMQNAPRTHQYPQKYTVIVDTL